MELPASLVTPFDLLRHVQWFRIFITDPCRTADLIDDVLVGRRIRSTDGFLSRRRLVSRRIDVTAGENRENQREAAGEHSCSFHDVSYFPTICGRSMLFSSQMLSMRSVSGSRRQVSFTFQGFVYALGSSIVTSMFIRPIVGRL